MEALSPLLAWLLLLPPALLLVWTLAQSFGAYAVLAAERGTPVSIGAGSLAAWTREGVSRALMILLSPLGRGQPAPRLRGEDRGRVPVMLVMDYDSQRSAGWFLRTFLVRRGWSWVWIVRLPSSDKRLTELAAILEHQVEQLAATTGVERIDVVGHGLGGLVAAWYLRHLGGASRVRRLVALGTPWKGTRMAVFGRHQVSRDLLPGLPLLDDLAPPPVPTVSIWSPGDPLVVPSSSALPDGVESVRIDGLGHWDMLFSGRVYRAVQAALSHPLPQAGP